jgi:hypothetical protein
MLFLAQDPAGSVAVAPLQFEGKVPADAQASLQQSVSDSLDTDAKLNIDAPSGCHDATCANEPAMASGADVLVTGKVEVTGRDYAFSMSVTNVADGSVVEQAEAFCDICTHDEAATALAGLVAGLNPAIATALAEAAAAKAESAPVEEEAPPEEAAAAPEPEPEGPTAEVTAFETDAGEGGRSPRAVAGWTLTGLSIPVLVTGIALLAVHDNPYDPSCEGGLRDASGRCPRRYETLGGGVTMTVLGAATLVTGIALVASNKKRKNERLRASIGPTSLQLSGAF